MSFWDSENLTPSSRTPLLLAPACGRCGLYRNPDLAHPKMKPYGKGKRKILVCGESPGLDEDRMGRPFVGKTGQLLQEAFAGAGLDLFRDCVVTNSLVCRPKNNVIPDPKMIQWCRPNLLKAVEDHRPETIILVGFQAVRSLLGHVWKEDLGDGVGKWVGHRVPCQSLNAWLCPIYHPSYVLRKLDERPEEGALLRRLWQDTVSVACAPRGRPWDKVPDWRSQVEVIEDPERAAAILDTFRSGTAALDYETDCVKPDSEWASIVYCAVCHQGKRTIAYPWAGAAVRATKRLLEDPRVKKVAHNGKFEIRWSLKYGVRPRNVEDSMLLAHVLDNRRGGKSLKFLAFVRLGLDAWDLDIKPYLQGAGNNARNRIREADPVKVMRYNGLDVIATYHLWKALKQELKTTPSIPEDNPRTFPRDPGF